MTGQWKWLGVAADTEQSHLRIMAHMIESEDDIQHVPARFHRLFDNARRAPIIYRKRRLGNISALMDKVDRSMKFYMCGPTALDMHLNHGERTLLQAQVAPRLAEFIQENITQLRDAALRRLDDRMCKVIQDARAALVDLNDQIETHLMAYKNAPIWDV